MFEKYYLEKDVPFNFYAYSPPGCGFGDYVVGKVVPTGTLTVERYKEYKDVGFNMVMSGCIATYYGEPFRF